MRIRKKKTKEKTYNPEFLQRIAPAGGFIPCEAYARTGTGYEACIHVYQFPSTTGDYWMTKFTRFDNTVTTVDIHTEDIIQVKKNLNKAIEEQASRKQFASDYSEFYDADKREQEMQRLYDEIDTMGEVIKMVHIRLYTAAMTLEGLEKQVEGIIHKLEADSYRAAIFLNETENEWRSMYLPAEEQMKVPHQVKGNPLEAKLLSLGNPFHFSCLEDPQGGYLGYTPCDGNVIFDAFYRSDSRVNYSAVIVGNMRYGKSTLLKIQLKERTIRGDFTRTFDITGEFSGLIRNLGGRVLHMDGTDGIINLLEIFAAGENDHTNYSQHWAKLKTCYYFLKPEASSEEIDAFHEVIEELYQEYGLLPGKGERITGRPARSYPTFSDLYQLILTKMERMLLKEADYSEIEKSLVEHKLLELNKVKSQIEMLINTYGYLFDGPTSIDNMNDVQTVSYNLSHLKEEDAAIFDLQIYNILSMCWGTAVTNGTIMKESWEAGKIKLEDVVHFLILIDESHRWVNATKLFALQFLSIYLREGPKYFVGIWLASQSIRDYTPEGSTEKGVETLKTIFELTQYKFIFHQDTNVLPILDRVFNNALTFAQRTRIPQLQRGETVLCINGEDNLEFKVHLTQADERLFAGGA